MKRPRLGRQARWAAAAVAISGLAGCSDGTSDQSLELRDGVLLSVYDNCVEIDGPTAKGSRCGEPLNVGVSVVGQAGTKWAYGLAPGDTARIAYGDESEERFVGLDGLRAFAIPYQQNAELVAEDANGEVLHQFGVPIP